MRGKRLRGKRLLLLVLLVLAALRPLTARPAEPWTRGDAALQVTYLSLATFDYGQTLHIARLCPSGRASEANPFLGSCPSRTRVHAYFAGLMLGHTLIAHELPPPWRRYWQLVTIGLEAGAVARNWNVGLRLAF